MNYIVVFVLIFGWTWSSCQTATVVEMSYSWDVICRTISENGEAGQKELQGIEELKAEILQKCKDNTIREVSLPGVTLGVNTKVYEDISASTSSTDKTLYVFPVVDCGSKVISVLAMKNYFGELNDRVKRNHGVIGSDIEALEALKQQVLEACAAGVLREASPPKDNLYLYVKAYDYLENTGLDMIVRDYVALPAVDCNVPTARKKQTLPPPQPGEPKPSNGASETGRSQDHTQNNGGAELHSDHKYQPNNKGIQSQSSHQNLGPTGSESNQRTEGTTSKSRNGDKHVDFDTSNNSGIKHEKSTGSGAGKETGDPFQNFINKKRKQWKDERIAEFGLEVEEQEF